MLVMHMPAEEAFWCLVAICTRYLPGYYSQGLVSSINQSHILLLSIFEDLISTVKCG